MDEMGRFLRQFRRPPGELPDDNIHTPDYHQGIWIVTADGELLSAFIRPKSAEGTLEAFTQGMLETIGEALSKTGELPRRQVAPRDLNPDRGIGMRSDGSVRLALTIRYFDNDRLSAWPTLDSIVFDAAEWKEFAPTRVVIGERFEVPPRVGSQLSRALSPNSDTSTMPRPEEVSEVSLWGNVRAIENGQVTVAYSGHIAGSHASEQPGLFTYGQSRLTGEGLYDISTRQLVSFNLLFNGTYRHIPPHDRTRRTRALLEWKLRLE